MKREAARISDFGERRVLGVRVGMTPVALFLLEDGTVSALHDRCSHANVKLSRGTMAGDEIECPAHGARFDCKTGNHQCMPAVVGVKPIPVTVEGGVIFVELE